MPPLNDMSDLLHGLAAVEDNATRAPPPQQQQQQQPQRQPPQQLLRRSISWPRQDKDLCRYHPGPDVDILLANRRDVWYQYEEMKHIKRKALVLSKEAQRYGLGSILTNTYGQSQENDGGSTQDALLTWVRNASSRRGLERWINNEYAAKRSDIRKRTIQSVLRAQLKLQESAISSVDADYSMKVLGRLSEAFSVDSKDFAHRMGLADEVTCREIHSAINNNSGDARGGCHGDSVSSQQPQLPTLPPTTTTTTSRSSKPKKALDPLALRKAPLRMHSPRTVLPGRSHARDATMPRRNLGLGAATTTADSQADFRHFY
jgi:hypothetical protein